MISSMRIRKYILPFLIFILPLLPGCLEDSVEPEINIQRQTSAELLYLLEERGDFINTTDMPALISAEELYNSAQNYLILDIRDNISFSAGHIEDAVNILTKDIPDYLQNSGLNFSSPIVLVSSAGQSASYYTCLLRLMGYYKSFALSFGMASWNNDFADIWRNAIDSQIDSARMNNISYLKPDLTGLPSVSSVDSLSSPEELLDYRINNLFSNTFSESLDYSFGTIDTAGFDPEVSLRTDQFYHDFSLDLDGYNHFYLVCFGPGQLYSPYGFLDKYPDILCHPLAAVYYQNAEIRSDLQSITHLQTLPNDKIIAVYSISGHASAFVAAYLRVLGYKAKSLVYGANSFVYNGLTLHSNLMSRSFTDNSVKNYSYRTGSQ